MDLPAGRPCHRTFEQTGPAAPRSPAPILLVPWWAIEGLSADGTGEGPGGETLQAVRVVTDAGTLTVLGEAATVSGLVARVARYWFALGAGPAGPGGPD